MGYTISEKSMQLIEKLYSTTTSTEEKEINTILTELITELYKTIWGRQLPTNVIIECTPDVNARAVEILDEQYREKEIEENKNKEPSDTFGKVMIPDNFNEVFIILISKLKITANSYHFIATVVHELKHVLDTLDLWVELGEPDSKTISSHGIWYTYMGSSEFSAARAGFSYYLQLIDIIFNEDQNEKEDSIRLVKNALGVYTGLALDLERKRDKHKLIYVLTYLLGHMAAYEDIFNESVIEEYFKVYCDASGISAVKKLSDIMKEMTTLKSLETNKDRFQLALDEALLIFEHKQ